MKVLLRYFTPLVQQRAEALSVKKKRHLKMKEVFQYFQ